MRSSHASQPHSGHRLALLRVACRDSQVIAVLVGYLAVSSWLSSGAAGDWQTTLFWAVQIIADLLLFLNTRYLSRHSDGKDRRFWRLFSIAGAAFCTGDTLRTVEGLVGLEHRDAGPVQTVCFAAGQAALVSALFGYRVLSDSTAAQRRFLLDATIVVCGSAAVIWYLLTSPEAASASSMDVITGLLVGAETLMVGFLAVKLVLSGQSPAAPAAASAMIIAGIMQVAITAVVPIYAAPLAYGRSLRLQLAPGVLLTIGSRLQFLEVQLPPMVRSVQRSRPYSVLPYVVVSVVYCLLLAALLDDRALIDPHSWGMMAAMGLVAGLVVWRQLLSATENARLIADLDHGLIALNHERDRFSSLVAHSSDITMVLDRSNVITYVSPAVERVLGLRPEDLLGSDLRDRAHPDDLARDQSGWVELRATPGMAYSSPGRLRTADGRWRWLDTISTNLLDDPSVLGIVYNARDVTDARELQQQLIQQASHDVLTQLGNRRLFAERLESAAVPGQASSQAALLMIDLDGFKPINDNHGHHVGDAVLVAVAERIRRCIRPTDTAARLGGDEFAVLMPGATLEQATRLAERFQAALAEPVTIGSLRLVIGASIGITVGDASDPESLQRQADAAMYAVKRGGGGEPVPVVSA